MTTQENSSNWYGCYSLYLKELKRFIKVYNQTIIAPAISALTFFAIFVLSIGQKSHDVNGIDFKNFIGYGLIIMSIVQNSFANSSSSIIMSKVLGYISDILIPPLSSIEIIIAYLSASVTRGLLVGIAVAIMLIPFIKISVYSYPILIISTLLACMLLGALGMIAGIMANNFDQNASITSYVITPLSFLSGTFYSVQQLPEWLQYVTKANPFFYMVTTFRYSLTGYSDNTNITYALIFLAITTLVLLVTIKNILDTGWRLKT